MEDEKKLKRACDVYQTLCETLDNMELKYRKDEKDLTIQLGLRGTDLPIEFSVNIIADRELIYLLSNLSFSVPEEKYSDVAMAICVVNNQMLNGNFDLHIGRGVMFFRIASSYAGSVIGNDYFEYMIKLAFTAIDNENTKFFMLIKGQTTIEEFIADQTKS